MREKKLKYVKRHEEEKDAHTPYKKRLWKVTGRGFGGLVQGNGGWLLFFIFHFVGVEGEGTELRRKEKKKRKDKGGELGKIQKTKGKK